VTLLFISDLIGEARNTSMVFLAINAGNPVLCAHTQELYLVWLRGNAAGWMTGICKITRVRASIWLHRLGFI
jgi:hypothetical protein